MRLKLGSAREESLSNYLTFAVIVAAIVTAPLTIAYFQDVEHPLITVADWLVWAVLLVAYAFYMANFRSASGNAAMAEAKEKLGKEHWAVRFIVRVEYYRSRVVTALLKFLPFIQSSTLRKRRQDERSKRQDLDE